MKYVDDYRDELVVQAENICISELILQDLRSSMNVLLLVISAVQKIISVCQCFPQKDPVPSLIVIAWEKINWRLRHEK